MKHAAIRRKVLPNLCGLLALAVTGAFASHGADVRMERVGRRMLCVTEGAVEEMPGQGLGVNVSKMRAYVNARTPQIVEARFKYLGASPNEARLGSGEMRRQFGLKLRAQDACNLVYAMWRIEPESKLVVSVKTNPGQHTSAECGNRGYLNIKPSRSSPVPMLRPGATHALRAELRGEELRVFVDNAVVWDGRLGADALAFDGPVGMRSDNARLEIELLADMPTGGRSNSGIPCRSGPSESE
jgi:hypothetical protein